MASEGRLKRAERLEKTALCEGHAKTLGLMPRAPVQQPPRVRNQCSRQALAFASRRGSSTLQRRASWAGLLPTELHTLILKHLPVTPDYGNITGVVGTVGKGEGTGLGQFKMIHRSMAESPC